MECTIRECICLVYVNGFFENIKLRFYTFTFINFPFALYKYAPPRALRSVSRGGAFIGRVDALERYAVFEDGDFAEAHLFAFRLFAARYAEDEGEEALRGFRYRLAVGDGAGVEVYPARFFRGELAVAGDFYRRRRGSEGRAASGREEDYVRACGCHRRRGYEVVAGAVEHIQAVRRDGVSVAYNVRNRRAAALLDAAAGLVFERRDSAFFVAGRRVFVYGLVVADEVVLEAVQHVRGLVEDFAADAAAEQHSLRAEHLGHFREHGAAAARDDHVAEDADGRVCRDAGEAVGAAALHAYDEAADGDGLALELRGVRGAFFKQRAPCGEFVLNVLAGEEFYPVRVVAAELCDELVVLQIFAA